MHRLFPLLLLVFIAAPLHAGVLKIGTLHIEDAVPLFLAERGLSKRCVLTGRVPFDDIGSYLAAADIAVEPKPADSGEFFAYNGERLPW